LRRVSRRSCLDELALDCDAGRCSDEQPKQSRPKEGIRTHISFQTLCGPAKRTGCATEFAWSIFDIGYEGVEERRNHAVTRAAMDQGITTLVVAQNTIYPIRLRIEHEHLIIARLGQLQSGR